MREDIVPLLVVFESVQELYSVQYGRMQFKYHTCNLELLLNVLNSSDYGNVTYLLYFCKHMGNNFIK